MQSFQHYVNKLKKKQSRKVASKICNLTRLFLLTKSCQVLIKLLQSQTPGTPKQVEVRKLLDSLLEGFTIEVNCFTGIPSDKKVNPQASYIHPSLCSAS